jgi:cytochrome b559 alpha subunit
LLGLVVDVHWRETVHRYLDVIEILGYPLPITVPALFISGWLLVSTGIAADTFM